MIENTNHCSELHMIDGDFRTLQAHFDRPAEQDLIEALLLTLNEEDSM